MLPLPLCWVLLPRPLAGLYVLSALFMTTFVGTDLVLHVLVLSSMLPAV